MTENFKDEQPRKLRVGVVFGGRSAEHEVSLRSARAVLAALDRNKYDVTLIGITRSGRWLPLEAPEGEVDPAKLMEPFANPEATDNTTHAALLPDPSIRGLAEIIEANPGPGLEFGQPLDVVFPVLHGPYGEDGTMQGLLELANVPYVGPGVLASAIGMDKVTQRELCRAQGIPVIDYVMIKRRDWLGGDEDNRAELRRYIEEKIGYPCFVKPVNMGSAVGVSKAHDVAELEKALDQAARFDRKIMIEKAVNPRELEVAVMGNDEPIASVVGEIGHAAEFYDYKTKYMTPDNEYHIPANIPQELSDRIRQLALKTYLTLDCAGLTRVDFFLDRDTNQLYLNEVNTIPGFTSISMYPMLWEASGISYPELVDRLINLALERHADKNRNELFPM
jgi:D-alanine-D-alanine ligase